MVALRPVAAAIAGPVSLAAVRMVRTGHRSLGIFTEWSSVSGRAPLTDSNPSDRPRPTVNACGQHRDSGMFSYPHPISRSDVPHTQCTAGGNPGRLDRRCGLYPFGRV
jgi:hypothetical protein